MNYSKAGQLRIAGQLRRVYGEHAPLAVEHHGEPDSWPLYSAALLARANYCLESITCLEAREVDASVLCRVLYEHVVTFAWIAVDPPRHLPRALKSEFDEIRKTNDAVGKFAGHERDVRRLDQLREYARGVAEPQMPDLYTRAVQADSHWSRVLDMFRRGQYGFEGQYTAVYRQFSLFTHPTVWGVEVFVSGAEPKKTIGRPLPRGDHSITFAPVLFAQALLIASARLGWPLAEEVLAIFEAERANA